MNLFESNIYIFEEDYTGTKAAEITVASGEDDGDGESLSFYFTVIQRKGSDEIEIYDMANDRKFLVEGTFIGVCTLLGLSLDPMELDPISVTDDSIKPVDADTIGNYIVTMQDGKWVDYDFDFDEEYEECEEVRNAWEEVKNVWDSYNQAPDMITIYNG